jgi:hypothetical protein
MKAFIFGARGAAAPAEITAKSSHRRIPLDVSENSQPMLDLCGHPEFKRPPTIMRADSKCGCISLKSRRE